MYPEFTEIQSFEEFQREERGEFVKLPVHRIVCPRCDGDGNHTNPAIDGNGITASEMEELGEDFAEGYVRGDYNVCCEVCHGKNVVDEVDLEKLQDNSPELYKAWTQWTHDAYDHESERRAEMRAGC